MMCTMTLNIIRDWITIKVDYVFIGKYNDVLDMSRLGIAPPAMEIYTLGPLVITMSIIAWPSTVTKV